MSINVAIVVQRYGLEVNGGAEFHARKLAEKLQSEYNIHVLTSCAKNYRYRFENEYDACTQIINGVKVTRFKISYFRSSEENFSKLDSKVLKNEASNQELNLWLKEVGPYSQSLIDYVSNNSHKYNFFIFFSYLYATTTLTLDLVKNKSILVPTAHDEKPIWSKYFETFFSKPRFIAFNTKAEKKLVSEICNKEFRSNDIVGIGFDFHDEIVTNSEDYLLYIGRIRKEKNCDLLFAYYLSLPNSLREKYPLILAGQSNMEIPVDKSIIHLGYVSEFKKRQLLSKCKVLINPSIYESLSMVVIEAWTYFKPVLVNKNSQVLRDHILESNGGMYFDSEKSFHDGINYLTDPRNDSITTNFGINGNRYAQKYNWSTILEKYKSIFNIIQKNNSRKKVAFIVQRMGKEVNGGAEIHCQFIAQRMSKYWDIEIITTCALDYITWENYYPTGIENYNGLKINRFKVDNPRNINTFNKLSDYINSLDYIDNKLADKWMKAQGPFSSSMLNYIENNKDTFDSFIFFTYLYAHSWFGIPKVLSKSILAPLAHDEWTIHLNIWNNLFSKIKRFIFNTMSERDFLRKRFSNIALNGPTLGVAVDRPPEISPQRFRDEFKIDFNFILYVGRVDPAKGCQSLFDYFLNINVRKKINPLKLVIIGSEVMEIPKHPDIVKLGFVNEYVKWSAIAACQYLIMPSQHESLSMVLLEAWTTAKPVLVNGKCDVLVQQCKLSNGGLWYENEEQYEKCTKLLTEGQYANVLGKNGYNFVKKNYNWKIIEDTYLEMVENM